MMKLLNKLAVVLAVALCLQSVSAVRTEPKNFVLNQKLEASWKWEVRLFLLLLKRFFFLLYDAFLVANVLSSLTCSLCLCLFLHK